jgi:hypothetical protein
MIFLFVYLISVVVCFFLIFIDNGMETNIDKKIKLHQGLILSLIPIINVIVIVVGVLSIYKRKTGVDLFQDIFNKMNNWFMNGGK